MNLTVRAAAGRLFLQITLHESGRRVSKVGMRDAIKYALKAWERWDGGLLQIIGTGTGGFLFFWNGITMPQVVLDNPLLSGLVSFTGGSVTGAVLMFCLRLCWWPVHCRVNLHGGVAGFFKHKLGNAMWPVALMGFGVLSFVIFFSIGFFWFLTQFAEVLGKVKDPLAVDTNNKSSSLGSNSIAPTPIILASEVDRHIKALDALYSVLEQSGEKLFQKISTLFLPWQYLPWNSTDDRWNPNYQALSVQSTKDSIPKIEELNRLYRQMVSEINAIILKYPDSVYYKSFLNTDFQNFEIENRSLTESILQLKDDADLNYLRLFLSKNTELFANSMQKFRTWFSDAKQKIELKRRQEIESLKNAYR